MKIKTKKKNADGIVRLETSGEIKEMLIKGDLINPKSSKILICFKGKDSSGIIELNPKEIESLYENTIEKLNLFEDSKIMKFEK